MATNWLGDASKFPLSRGGDPDPHPTHVSLGPPEPTPQTAGRSVLPILQDLRPWPTDRPRYSGNGRPRLMWSGSSDTGWLGSRVVSVLDSGAVGPEFKSQSRRCRVRVLGKLFTPVFPVHQAAKLVAAVLRVARVTAGLAESNGSLPPGL